MENYEEKMSGCENCGTPIFDRKVKRGDSWVQQTWCSRPCEGEIQQNERVFYKNTKSGIELNSDNSNFIKKDDMSHPSRIQEHNEGVQKRLMNIFSQNKTQETEENVQNIRQGAINSGAISNDRITYKVIDSV